MSSYYLLAVQMESLFVELGQRAFRAFPGDGLAGRESLDNFARPYPHSSIVERLEPLMGQTDFRFFPFSGSE